MHLPRALPCAALLLVLAGACRDTPVVRARAELRLAPDGTLGFPGTYVGKARDGALTVENAGRSAVEVAWAAPEAGGPFTLGVLPSRVQPGTQAVSVSFRPQGPGPVRARLVGRTPEGTEVALDLEGEGLAPPACPEPLECHATRFDLAAEACVEEVLEDGTGCDPHNACVTGATCQAGICRGAARVCPEDGDRCTLEVCNPLSGCASVPAPPCPGDGACQRGACEPAVGCVLRPAEDGTSCGPARGCGPGQDVCIEGVCRKGDPPDGFVCAAASPCQAEGRCAGEACVQPAPTALTSDWTYDARAEGRDLHDLLVGAEGDVILSGFYGVPRLNAAGAAPVDAPVRSRRCMLWNERLLCMDYGGDGAVSLVDRDTGRVNWVLRLAEKRPDLAAQSSRLFLARLAVIAPDRLAAVFEGYPADSNPNAQPPPTCRVYFLVVMDPGGGLVSAQRLVDPLLDVCNHPHPFGLASDVRGDLYVAFSPTVTNDAPLMPGSPMLLLAYSSDGVERWRRTLPMAGGELAVAQGRLFPERGEQVLSTADGAPVASVGRLGRAVATSHRLVRSPVPGEGTLEGHALPALAPAWTYALPDGEHFVSRELRVVTLPDVRGEPEPVALGFAQEESGAPRLVGVRTEDGSEAFRCPVAFVPRGPPALAEVGPGVLYYMDGATTLGEGDPPFAGSRARFQRFQVPGLLPAEVPWSGTFGGPGHSHRETRVRQ